MNETNSPAPAPAAAPCDVNQLAQAVAPLVAKLMAEGQANSVGGPMQNAGAYRDGNGRLFYIRNGRQVYAEDGKPAVKAETESETEIKDKPETPHLDDEANKGTEKNADGSPKERYGKTGNKKHDAKMVGTREWDEENGMDEWDEDDYQMSPKAKKYVADLKATVANLSKSVLELQRNSEASNQAAKRAMLTSKCRELVGQGYAIGDAAKIQRHVERMIDMDTDGVKQYLEDIQTTAPKVEVQRHGTSDIIRRPGSETDAEKYLLEHPEMASVGIDKSVIELSEFLGG